MNSLGHKNENRIFVASSLAMTLALGGGLFLGTTQPALAGTCQKSANFGCNDCMFCVNCDGANLNDGEKCKCKGVFTWECKIVPAS